jgi:predicted transcriptional regulator
MLTTHVTRISSTTGDSGIRQMRNRLGLTQKGAAELAGVAESTIKRAEKTGSGHNFARIKETLENELEKAAGPRSAVENIAIAIDGSPSDLVREFLAILDGMPTVEQQWAAVKTFAFTVDRVADSQLRKGLLGDAQ